VSGAPVCYNGIWATLENDVVRSASPSGSAAASLARSLTASRVCIGLIGILLLSAVLRLWGLGGRGLWFDEAYSIFVAEQPLTEIPRLLSQFDTHPPLYYALLHFWIALFGSGETTVRIPTALAGIGVVVVTFQLGRRLGGDRLGLMAAALVALSPFQLEASREARMYPLLALFTMGASDALWRAVEEGERRHWIAYVILMTLALYTHHFAFLILLVQGMFVLISVGHAERRAWRLSLVGVVIGYLPLLPMLYAQFFTARGWPEVRPPMNLGQLTDLFGMLSFGGSLFGMGSYFSGGSLRLLHRIPVLLPFAVLALLGAAGLRERRSRVLVLLLSLLPIALVVIISTRWNLFFARYFSFTQPPFAVLLASGVFVVTDAARERRSTALTILLAFLASFYLTAANEMYRARPLWDWRGMTQHVSQRIRPDDFILFIPAFARIPFEYYFRGAQSRMSTNPEVLIRPDVKPRVTDPTYSNVLIVANVDEKKLAEISQMHPRMWIVATVPIGLEARRQIAILLAPYFREVDGRAFGYVYAFLWESRVYRAPK